MATSGYERFFPYAEPYPNQREAMDRIANALARRQDVLMEGAPGTGKTVAALVPALDHAREHDKTVVITTNVHQQTRQFVDDARAITREEPIRAVVFRGKASMCHIDVGYEECQTLRDTTRDLVEMRTERRELAERAGDLLEDMRAGVDGAAEARQAVTDELAALSAELDDLEAANTCAYYRHNLVEDTDAFFGWLFDDVRTPDEIYEYADERELCGYELLKEGMEGVDLVVCNYHHLLDPTIREQFFRWLGRDPADVVTVFDEAHNIEGAARDHASRTLTEHTLERALSELSEVDDGRAESARNVVSAFLTALRDTYRAALDGNEGPRPADVGENWTDVAVVNEDRRDDLTLAFLREYEGRGIDTEVELAAQLGREIDERYERAYREGEATSRQECQTLRAAGFIEAWMDEGTDPGQHPIVSVRRDAGSDDLYGRAELYTCIPSDVTADLFDDVHASILMSATLRPFEVTEDVLGLEEPARLAYGLEYPEENRRTFAVETPPLFKRERENPETQAVVEGVLRDAIRFTPGNTLVFFPSYAEAARYHGRLTGGGDGTDAGVDGPDGPGGGGGRSGDGDSGGLGGFGGGDAGVERDGVTYYLDEPGVRAESARQSFVDSGSGEGALFTSLWGTLAEGVSFDGDDARTVVVVGVPYPHLSDRMAAVQDAYGRAYGERGSGGGRSRRRGGGNDAGWRYAVEIPTIRKTRQALGRVIRSPEDFGVRVLVDKRYTRASAEMGKYGVRDTFPSEEREELIDVAPGKLKFAMLNFFTDHDAYDGAPPAP